MKNKKMWFKFGVIAFVFMGFVPSFTSAIIYKINENLFEGTYLKNGYVTDKMTYIHFADNGNDFGGFFYFSNGTGENESGTGYYVYTDNTSADKKVFECGDQIKGFYYNAQKGERLWPLDAETRSRFAQHDLTMTGGIYTSCMGSGYNQELKRCEQNNEKYYDCVTRVNNDYVNNNGKDGYYGSITYVYTGQTTKLTVGIGYNTGGRSTDFVSIESGSDLYPTFVRIKSKYPVGFVYDYNGGVGLVGCRFTGNLENGMKELLNEVGIHGDRIKSRFKYDGNNVVYTGGNVTGVDCKDVISQADTLLKVVIEGLVGVGKNTASDKFENLSNVSDKKMQTFITENISNGTMMNYARKKAELLCRGKWGDNTNNSNGNIICYSGDNSLHLIMDNLKNKTLIVKQGDVVVNPGTGGVNDDSYYDIFLLSGNLIIDETTAEKYMISENGFLSGSDNCGHTCFNTGNYENLFNSGIIGVASYLKGNFIVNGSLTGNNGSLSNKYFIYGKLITKNEIEDLEKLFSWRCINGIATDNHACLDSDYKNAALVVIDQNYHSPLLNN